MILGFLLTLESDKREQAFKRLNEGFKDMADTAASLEFSTIAGLLRGAPDLTQHIENVESQFTEVDDTTNVLQPQDGKDEAYDEIQSQIADIEKELKQELKAMEKKVGYASNICVVFFAPNKMPAIVDRSLIGTATLATR